MWMQDPEYRSTFLNSQKESMQEADTEANLPNIGNPKYSAMFEQAKKRGGESSVKATHYILSQTDPSYRQKSWKPK